MVTSKKEKDKADVWVADLSREVDKLKLLLDNPEHGLLTWAQHIHYTMENLIELWERGV